MTELGFACYLILSSLAQRSFDDFLDKPSLNPLVSAVSVGVSKHPFLSLLLLQSKPLTLAANVVVVVVYPNWLGVFVIIFEIGFHVAYLSWPQIHYITEDNLKKNNS